MAHTIENNGWYVAMNVNSRTVMDLNDGDSGNGTKVQGWDFSWTTTHENQTWQFQEDGDAWRIINKKSGTYLDLNDGGTANGTKIQGWSKAETDDQRWYVTAKTEPGEVCRWIIKNKKSSTVADLNNGSNDNGTKIQGWTATDNSPNQQWILLAVNA